MTNTEKQALLAKVSAIQIRVAGLRGGKTILHEALNVYRDAVLKTIRDFKEEPMRKVIAIDFDGTLCVNAYPGVGEPKWDVINKAKAEHVAGAALILWTCREGELLEDALAACRSWGLEFDAVNDSLPEWKAAWGTNPRKIGATEYWDDKAVVIK